MPANGFYQNQALPLAAATASCLWLFEQSGATTLVAELTDLTHLTTETITRWGQVKSDEALADLLQHHPDQYVALLLVGHEVLAGALRTHLRHALLIRTENPVAALEEYLTLGQTAIDRLLDIIIPGLEASGHQPRLDQLRVQGAFARFLSDRPGTPLDAL